MLCFSRVLIAVRVASRDGLKPSTPQSLHPKNLKPKSQALGSKIANFFNPKA